MTNHMPWNEWILVLTKALEQNSTNWIVRLHSKNIIDSCRINLTLKGYIFSRGGLQLSGAYWPVHQDVDSKWLKMVWQIASRLTSLKSRWVKKSQQSSDGHIEWPFPGGWKTRITGGYLVVLVTWYPTFSYHCKDHGELNKAFLQVQYYFSNCSNVLAKLDWSRNG